MFALLFSPRVLYPRTDININASLLFTAQRHSPAHLWMFGSNGVQIYNADGSEELKSLPPEKVCKETLNSDGTTRVRCDFMDVVSDGKKVRPFYVVWSGRCTPAIVST